MHTHLDYSFTLNTDLVRLCFIEGTCADALVRLDGDLLTVAMPAGFDFNVPRHQEWANKVLCEVLRKRAKQLLPPRLDATARQFDLRYQRVYIKDVCSRWGSCSSLGNINLSLWLLLAPSRLVDYVIRHELAHLNEMNHSPRFWAEVDRMTGGPGQGKLLEREMKAFARGLFAAGWRK